MKCLLAFVTV